MDNNIPRVLFKYKSFDKYTADILRNSEAFFCPASKLDDQFESAISISKRILNNDLDGYMRDLMPFILEKIVPSSSEVLKNTDIAAYFNNGKLNVPKFKSLVLKHDSSISHSQLDMLVNFINKLQNIQSNKKLCKALKKLMDIKNEIGVFSMTTRPNNQPMWAWYAKGYDGYVIEYNIEQYLNEHDEMAKDLKYVNYSDKRENNPMHIILNAFYEALYKSLGGLEVKIRESRGNRIKAACGQLVSEYNRQGKKTANRTVNGTENSNGSVRKSSFTGRASSKRHPYAKHKNVGKKRKHE